MKAIIEIECDDEDELNFTLDKVQETIDERGDLEKYSSKEVTMFKESWD